MNNHEKWMKEAILEATKAANKNEVPIGSVIVFREQIIGRGHNLRETLQDPTAHAEIIALRQASCFLKSWRLLECQLYVTLEPCPMCAGAIIQARIPQIIYGATDPKAGCAGTIYNLLQEKKFNHQVEIISNCMELTCSEMLRDFFKKLRQS